VSVRLFRTVADSADAVRRDETRQFRRLGFGRCELGIRPANSLRTISRIALTAKHSTHDGRNLLNCYDFAAVLILFDQRKLISTTVYLLSRPTLSDCSTIFCLLLPPTL